MSCFCLRWKRLRQEPADAGDNHVAASGAAAGKDGGGQRAAHNDLSAAQTEVQTTPDQQQIREDLDNPAEHDGRALATGPTESATVSLSDVNGRIHDPMPQWVQREHVASSVSGHKGPHFPTVDDDVLVGEIGELLHGTGGFQTRATPRTVFRPAEQHPGTGHAGHGSSGPAAPPEGRPPRPSREREREASRHEGAVPAAGGLCKDRWTSEIEPSPESGSAPGAAPATQSRKQSEPSRSQAGGGAAGEPDHKEELVRCSEGRCQPGAKVCISRAWLQATSLQRFRGLRGTLTRAGIRGTMWAAFPGSPEQEFNTGLDGQYVLCYAPAPPASRPTSVVSPETSETVVIGYATTDTAATGMHRAQNTQDATADTSEAIANNAPLAAPRGASRYQLQAAARVPSAGLPPPGSGLPPSARGLGGGGSSLLGPMGSARTSLSSRLKERPPSARSRQAMGAPPLISARSARPSARAMSGRVAAAGRAPSVASDVDRFLSPRDGLTPESPRDWGRDGRLFKYPEWDEYDLFDSDDLWSEHAYLLYGEPLLQGQLPAVFVWVGQYFDECDYDDDLAVDRFVQRAVADFQTTFGGNVPIGSVTVVKELEEEEDFWEYFVLG